MQSPRRLRRWSEDVRAPVPPPVWRSRPQSGSVDVVDATPGRRGARRSSATQCRWRVRCWWMVGHANRARGPGPWRSSVTQRRWRMRCWWMVGHATSGPGRSWIVGDGTSGQLELVVPLVERTCDQADTSSVGDGVTCAVEPTLSNISCRNDHLVRRRRSDSLRVRCQAWSKADWSSRMPASPINVRE